MDMTIPQVQRKNGGQISTTSLHLQKTCKPCPGVNRPSIEPDYRMYRCDLAYILGTHSPVSLCSNFGYTYNLEMVPLGRNM